jgi:alkaline phosphatase D
MNEKSGVLAFALNRKISCFIVLIVVFMCGCSNKNEVNYFWAGALQPTSIRVNVKLLRIPQSVQLVVSTEPEFSSTITGPAGTIDPKNKDLVALFISGLKPNQKYYYAIQSDGRMDKSPGDIGSFVTPGDSAYSFRFTLASCLHSNSHHPVLQRMSEKNPLFFLQMGDFHYDNPNSAYSLRVHELPYEQLLANPTCQTFFKKTPLAYMWDDHDFAGNNSDSTAGGKTNARIAYREYIPHYTFGTTVTGNDAPIYQSFTIGRVHFILTDLRSCRSQPSMMGTAQKEWFKMECINARNARRMIAWVSSVSYGGTLSDNWGGFSSERTELADFFRDSSIKNLCILSGDAHMIAIDNGSHHDFSSGHNNSNQYPVFQAAALNQTGSYKGGTYSEGGPFPNPSLNYGQYGLVEVNDHGDSTIQINFIGYRVDKEGKETKLASYSFVRALR